VSQGLAAVWDRSWTPGEPVSTDQLAEKADKLAEKLAEQLSMWLSRDPAPRRSLATGPGPVADPVVVVAPASVDQRARATVVLEDLSLPAALHDPAQQRLDEVFGPDRWGESGLLPQLAVASALRDVVLQPGHALTPADRQVAQREYQHAVLLAATQVMRRGDERLGRTPTDGEGAVGRTQQTGLAGLLVEGTAPALTELARAWAAPTAAQVPLGVTSKGRGPAPLVLALRDVIRETLAMQLPVEEQQQLAAGLGDRAWQELAASVTQARRHWPDLRESLLQQLGEAVDGLVRPLQDLPGLGDGNVGSQTPVPQQSSGGPPQVPASPLRVSPSPGRPSPGDRGAPGAGTARVGLDEIVPGRLPVPVPVSIAAAVGARGGVPAVGVLPGGRCRCGVVGVASDPASTSSVGVLAVRLAALETIEHVLAGPAGRRLSLAERALAARVSDRLSAVALAQLVELGQERGRNLTNQMNLMNLTNQTNLTNLTNLTEKVPATVRGLPPEVGYAVEGVIPALNGLVRSGLLTTQSQRLLTGLRDVVADAVVAPARQGAVPTEVVESARQRVARQWDEAVRLDEDSGTVVPFWPNVVRDLGDATYGRPSEIEARTAIDQLVLGLALSVAQPATSPGQDPGAGGQARWAPAPDGSADSGPGLLGEPVRGIADHRGAAARRVAGWALGGRARDALTRRLDEVWAGAAGGPGGGLADLGVAAATRGMLNASSSRGMQGADRRVLRRELARTERSLGEELVRLCRARLEQRAERESRAAASSPLARLGEGTVEALTQVARVWLAEAGDRVPATAAPATAAPATAEPGPAGTTPAGGPGALVYALRDAVQEIIPTLAVWRPERLARVRAVLDRSGPFGDAAWESIAADVTSLRELPAGQRGAAFADVVARVQAQLRAFDSQTAAFLRPEVAAASGAVDQWAAAMAVRNRLGLSPAAMVQVQARLDAVFGNVAWGASTLLPELAVAWAMQDALQDARAGRGQGVILGAIPDYVVPRLGEADQRALTAAYATQRQAVAAQIERLGRVRAGPVAGPGAGPGAADNRRTRLIDGTTAAVLDLAQAWTAPSPTARATPPGPPLRGLAAMLFLGKKAAGARPLVKGLRHVLADTLTDLLATDDAQQAVRIRSRMESALAADAWRSIADAVQRVRFGPTVDRFAADVVDPEQDVRFGPVVDLERERLATLDRLLELVDSQLAPLRRAVDTVRGDRLKAQPGRAVTVTFLEPVSQVVEVIPGDGAAIAEVQAQPPNEAAQTDPGPDSRPTADRLARAVRPARLAVWAARAVAQVGAILRGPVDRTGRGTGGPQRDAGVLLAEVVPQTRLRVMVPRSLAGALGSRAGRLLRGLPEGDAVLQSRVATLAAVRELRSWRGRLALSRAEQVALGQLSRGLSDVVAEEVMAAGRAAVERATAERAAAERAAVERAVAARAMAALLESETGDVAGYVAEASAAQQERSARKRLSTIMEEDEGAAEDTAPGSSGAAAGPAGLSRRSEWLLQGLAPALAQVDAEGLPAPAVRRLRAAVREGVLGALAADAFGEADPRTQRAAREQLTWRWNASFASRQDAGTLAESLRQQLQEQPASATVNEQPVDATTVSNAEPATGQETPAGVETGTGTTSSPATSPTTTVWVPPAGGTVQARRTRPPGLPLSARQVTAADWALPETFDLAAGVTSAPRPSTLADAVPESGVYSLVPAHLVDQVRRGVEQILADVRPQQSGSLLLHRLAAAAAIADLRSDGAAGRDPAGPRLIPADSRALAAAVADLHEAAADQVRQAGAELRGEGASTSTGSFLPATAEWLLAGLPDAIGAVTALGLPPVREQQVLTVLREAVSMAIARAMVRPQGLRAVVRTAEELAQLWEDIRQSAPSVPASELAAALGDQLAGRLTESFDGTEPASNAESDTESVSDTEPVSDTESVSDMESVSDTASVLSSPFGPGTPTRPLTEVETTDPYADSRPITDQWRASTSMLEDLGLPAAAHDLVQQRLDALFGISRWGESSLVPHLAVASALRDVVLRLENPQHSSQVLPVEEHRALVQEFQRSLLLGAAQVMQLGQERLAWPAPDGETSTAAADALTAAADADAVTLLTEGAAMALVELAQAWISPMVRPLDARDGFRDVVGPRIGGFDVQATSEGPAPMVRALQDVIREGVGLYLPDGERSQLRAALGDQVWRDIAADVNRVRYLPLDRRRELLQELGDAVDDLVLPLQGDVAGATGEASVQAQPTGVPTPVVRPSRLGRWAERALGRAGATLRRAASRVVPRPAVSCGCEPILGSRRSRWRAPPRSRPVPCARTRWWERSGRSSNRNGFVGVWT
jgi:hypothetical protein